MTSLKAFLGFIPSHLINWQLNRNLPGKGLENIIDFVNKRPAWFGEVDDDVLVKTNFGVSIYCGRRSGIGQTIISEGQWEGLLSRTILATLKQGDIAIDVGANIGYDTLLMSKAVGSEGTVFAFEPELQNLTLLLKNVRSVNENNIVVQSLALSDESGLARISVSDPYNRGMPNLRPMENGPSQLIMAARLDQLVLPTQFDRIALVKMDIEGFEYKALQGMGQLIDRIDCLTCEINQDFLKQCGSSAELVFKYMRDRGFISFCSEPVGDGKWVASDHNYKILTSHGRHFDALFCRNVSETLKSLIGPSR